ncbi:YbaN family protein [Psychromonas sp. Urea-02u-13]|uniref:YbaN family protein n=1 Tax=Psychromonas sp. Urea-02u-13 TaxID=2058326 RepID=UPI0012FF5295|nr:YbaN family protein [Psychromonas sp. Urea-02u-13]
MMVKKYLYITLGFISLATGFVGIVVPGLPTTSFALLALFFFSRSSKKFHDRLLNNKVMGPLIEKFRCGQGLTRKDKTNILLLTWFSICFALFFFIENAYIQWFLAIILLFKTWFIIRYKSKETPLNEQSNSDNLTSK